MSKFLKSYLMLKILNNDKFTTAQNRHFLVSLKIPILNTLPVRAKVKINRSPILLPLQGVGVYALIPRALPWAVNWLPFQGAPFRTLFVYHVRMLRRHVIWLKKNAQWLQILALVHPFSRRGVARHAPVASRTQAAAPHFGTVGEAAALKLLREETPKKRFEPMFYDVV